VTMPEISPQALKEVEEALKRYENTVSRGVLWRWG
jgi:hypothetical protein